MERNNLDISREIERTLPNNLRGLGIGVQKTHNLGDINYLNGDPEIRITLCPLYAHGTLDKSTLIEYPAKISDSRVHGKWQSGVALIKSFNDILNQYMIQPKISFTFADLGVISSNHTGEVDGQLRYSERLYRQAIGEEIEQLGIECNFSRYSDLRSDFPRFIKPGGGMDKSFTSNKDMDVKMNAMLQRLNDTGIKFSWGFNKKTISKMMSEFGIKITEGLLAQYGMFDAITTSDQSVNTFFERSGLLLKVTDLFPHSNRPRIDILC